MFLKKTNEYYPYGNREVSDFCYQLIEDYDGELKDYYLKELKDEGIFPKEIVFNTSDGEVYFRYKDMLNLNEIFNSIDFYEKFGTNLKLINDNIRISFLNFLNGENKNKYYLYEKYINEEQIVLEFNFEDFLDIETEVKNIFKNIQSFNCLKGINNFLERKDNSVFSKRITKIILDNIEILQNKENKKLNLLNKLGHFLAFNNFEDLFYKYLNLLNQNEKNDFFYSTTKDGENVLISIIKSENKEFYKKSYSSLFTESQLHFYKDTCSNNGLCLVNYIDLYIKNEKKLKI